jgi:hypothetical protein
MIYFVYCQILSFLLDLFITNRLSDHPTRMLMLRGGFGS